MSMYQRPLRPDELMHWSKSNHKYSLRKWINGKWRYFYGSLNGDNLRRNAYKAKVDYDIAKRNTEYAKRKTAHEHDEIPGYYSSTAYRAKVKEDEALKRLKAANKKRDKHIVISTKRKIKQTKNLINKGKSFIDWFMRFGAPKGSGRVR